MGHAASTIHEEKQRPIDASDVETLEHAKNEITRLRGLLHEYKASEVPDLTHYLSRVFNKADNDGSGELNADEFWLMIREDLCLGLSDAQIAELQTSGDYDTDGKVSWEEFVAMAPQIFSGLLAGGEDSVEDWCSLQTDAGEDYYYNKRTGESVWDRPEILGNTTAEGENTAEEEIATAEEGEKEAEGEKEVAEEGENAAEE